MREEADNVLSGLDLMVKQPQQYDAVKRGFDTFYTKEKSDIQMALI